MLRQTKLFDEEHATFLIATQAFHASQDALQGLPLMESLTLWDVLVVQRFFHAIHLILARRVRASFAAAPETAINSMLPSFGDDDLQGLLEALLGDARKAEAMLAFLGWSRAGDQYFDVQCQPFLRSSGAAVVPVALFVASNMIRNSMQRARERVRFGTEDPGEQFLAREIIRAGGSARPNLKYSFAGRRYEVDLVGALDGLLIVAEVKRTLMPTNTKELEGSLYEALDAANQLDRFLTHWNDPQGRATISSALGFDVSSITDTVSVIVLPNRMLAGARLRGHPVRGLMGLAAFLHHGESRVGGVDGVKDIHVSFWQGSRLAVIDVLAYLRDDRVHRAIFDAMEIKSRPRTFAGVTVTEESYTLPIDGLRDATLRVGRPL